MRIAFCLWAGVITKRCEEGLLHVVDERVSAHPFNDHVEHLVVRVAVVEARTRLEVEWMVGDGGQDGVVRDQRQGQRPIVHELGEIVEPRGLREELADRHPSPAKRKAGKEWYDILIELQLPLLHESHDAGSHELLGDGCDVVHGFGGRRNGVLQIRVAVRTVDDDSGSSRDDDRDPRGGHASYRGPGR